MKKILSGVIPLLLITFSSNAQLWIHNPSFEANWTGPTESVPPPPDWNNCVCCIDTSIVDINPKHSTLVIFNSQNTMLPQDGKTFIGLSGWYAQTFASGTYTKVGGEMCSSELICDQTMYKGHRYKLSVFAYADWDTGNNPPPQLIMYAGAGSCDTSQRIFTSQILHDQLSASNPIPTWKNYTATFVAKSAWNSISLRCHNIYKDTTTAWAKGTATVYLDNMSAIVPDTAYNSLHFPIVQVCNGNTIFLQSPYPLQEEQYWYTHDTLAGTGYGIYVQPNMPTMYTLVVGKDSCIPSVIQALIYPSCENELVFPTAFTPNGDHENDVFRAIQNMDNYQINNYELKIYSRWGNCVYKGNNIESGWDGEGCTTETYFYVARYNAYNGKEKIKKGTVTLLK